VGRFNRKAANRTVGGVCKKITCEIQTEKLPQENWKLCSTNGQNNEALGWN
jgi:hypothetical protein